MKAACEGHGVLVHHQLEEGLVLPAGSAGESQKNPEKCPQEKESGLNFSQTQTPRGQLTTVSVKEELSRPPVLLLTV